MGGAIRDRPAHLYGIVQVAHPATTLLSPVQVQAAHAAPSSAHSCAHCARLRLRWLARMNCYSTGQKSAL